MIVPETTFVIDDVEHRPFSSSGYPLPFAGKKSVVQIRVDERETAIVGGYPVPSGVIVLNHDHHKSAIRLIYSLGKRSESSTWGNYSSTVKDIIDCCGIPRDRTDRRDLEQLEKMLHFMVEAEFILHLDYRSALDEFREGRYDRPSLISVKKKKEHYYDCMVSIEPVRQMLYLGKISPAMLLEAMEKQNHSVGETAKFMGVRETTLENYLTEYKKSSSRNTEAEDDAANILDDEDLMNAPGTRRRLFQKYGETFLGYWTGARL